MNVMVLDIINIAAALITTLGGYAALLSSIRWYRRPRLYAGLIPDKQEMSVYGYTNRMWGRKHAVHEYEFDARSLSSKTATRNVMPRNDGCLELFIVVTNLGRSDAEKYRMQVSFSSPSVVIVDVDSETLAPDSIYTSAQSVLNKSRWASRVVPKRIVDRYEAFGIPASYLSLVGSLGAEAFEGVLVCVKAPKDIKEFDVHMRIDYIGDKRGVSLFSQKVMIRK